MKNLFNFLIIILISLLDIQVVYGEKAPNCLVPHQEETFKCLAYIPSYYYNIENDECVFFMYGGCGGNDLNNFMSKKKCEQDCEVQTNVEIGPSPCLVPYKKPTETCLAFIPSYYYDIAENKCVFFVYGGCGGNANHFYSQEECEHTCMTALTMRKSLKRTHLTQKQMNALRSWDSRNIEALQNHRPL